MKEALEEISKTKRQRYETWRRSTLGGLKLGRRVASALMWTIIPAIVCLQVRGQAMTHATTSWTCPCLHAWSPLSQGPVRAFNAVARS